MALGLEAQCKSVSVLSFQPLPLACPKVIPSFHVFPLKQPSGFSPQDLGEPFSEGEEWVPPNCVQNKWVSSADSFSESKGRC